MDRFVPTETGHWVNEKFAHIAEIIQDYDPTMYLAWIPPEHRTDNTPPYAVIHHPDGLAPYKMFHLQENELDHRVIARICRGDLTKMNVLDQIEAEEAARQILEAKQAMEREEERLDIVKSIVRSPLHTYKHNGKKIS